ncbi:MBOAT family protein [Candidatus Nitrosopelagicus sp.]|nr:MBOAT family protein [Candidatus Nitrosopelagicus sp.]
MIFTILLHFYVGQKIHNSKDKLQKKIFFVVGLIGSVSILGFFKYTDFVISQFNLFGTYVDLNSEIPLLNLALPIGISFYTFQSMSYIIDIYRGSLKPSKTLKEYALFVAFFPPLVAGPILRANEFLPQLREKISQNEVSQKLKLFVISNQNLKFGITLMSIGFFKKMFFSDNIAPLVNYVFSNPIGLESFSIMIGTIAFGIQLYCDFSGYSDIAIGAAAILGFKIPLNFNKPFFASSPSDFWTKWHISLSTWVRDYLYYPLVFKNRNSNSLVFISLIISMILMGIWHGASWNFLIWGGIHGLFLACYTILRKKFPGASSNKFFKSKIGKITSILITQYLVFFSFIAFWMKDFHHMAYAMEKYVILDFATSGTIQVIRDNELPILLLILFGILHFISYKKGNMVERISKLKIRYWVVILFVFFISIAMSYVGSAREFIYFQF